MYTVTPELAELSVLTAILDSGYYGVPLSTAHKLRSVWLIDMMHLQQLGAIPLEARSF